MSSAVLLAIAVAGLLVGPTFALAWPERRGWRRVLDAVSAVLVATLVFLHLLPHAVEHGAVPTVVGGAAGLLAPLALHRIGQPGDRTWGLLALSILSAHAVLDGAALAFADPGVGLGVALAVAAHRLPVGLVVFTAASEPAVRGRWSPVLAGTVAIAVLAAATVVGLVIGAPLVLAAPDAVVGALESMVAFSLLHVVMFRHRHLDDGAGAGGTPVETAPDADRRVLTAV